jgi:glutamate-1-semialdehyde 2,1-aminomutase
MPSSSSLRHPAEAPAEQGPVLARGVSSGARTRTHPLLLAGASGATVIGVDGRRITDYVLGMGPMLLGHGRPEILDAVREQLTRGVLYGTAETELALADRLHALLPHAERVAMVSTGSEATHLAVRIARTATGRPVIVKFEGHYHGWIDPLFVNSQSNPAAAADAHPVPVLHGVQGAALPADVVVIRWNDRDELERVFAEYPGRIAGVVLEPVPMNFGTFLPAPGYTELLRELCTRDGAMLIFDEVLSGFRVALGGAAELLGVRPDLAVYAKAIAGGFPMAVVAGTDDAMAPIVRGPIVPAGTYSGHLVSVAAAHATLDILESGRDEVYAGLETIGARLEDGISAAAEQRGAPLSVNRVGSVLQLFWGLPGPAVDYATAWASDRQTIARISEEQLDTGSLVSPRGLLLLSTAHTAEDVDRLVEGIAASLDALAAGAGAVR